MLSPVLQYAFAFVGKVKGQDCGPKIPRPELGAKDMQDKGQRQTVRVVDPRNFHSLEHIVRGSLSCKGKGASCCRDVGGKA